MSKVATRPGTPARILDLLETDGGWLSSDALHGQLGGPKINVLRALQRLSTAGLVESRWSTWTPRQRYKEWRWMS